MNLNFVTVNDLRIAYRMQNENAQRTIFFIHGHSGSSRLWRKQLESDLLADYRLITLDLPGHGDSTASSKPEDDYSPVGTAKILSQCVQEISCNLPYILTGFSYGTNLISEMLNFDILPSGLFMLSPCVIGEKYGLDKVFSPSDPPSIFLYNEPSLEKVSNFIRQSIPLSEEIDTLAVIEDYLNVGQDFKPALFKSAAQGMVTDEILNIKQTGIPALVVFGANDSLLQIQYLDAMPFPVWRNTIHKIPGTGHWVNLEAPGIFNQLLAAYTEEMTAER